MMATDLWEQEGIVNRYRKNPILLPVRENRWESKLVYNCAAFKLEGFIYLIYRAMGEEHVSRFGLALSKDGRQYERFSYPVFSPKTEYEISHSTTMERERERGGVEDPRAMVIGDFLYLIYTAFHKECHLAMVKIRLADFQKMVQSSKERSSEDLSKEWNDSWERVGLIFPHLFGIPDLFSRNAVLMSVNKELFLLLYRIHKGDIVMSLANHPEGPWEEKGISFLSKKFPWEQERIGISTPPIAIIDGHDHKHLFFYHGVEERQIDHTMMKIYHLGAFFLSAHVTSDKLLLTIERLKNPVLSPVKDYEIHNEWLLSAGVHAVFSCGAVPFEKGEIFVYYGSGDSNINLGKVNVHDLLQEEMLVEYKEIDLKLFPIRGFLY